MRKSFDGLAATASRQLEENPLCGTLFVFFNRNRTIVKMLFWDLGGFAIIAKRLEKGTFQIPRNADKKIDVSPTELQLILEGINLGSIRYRKRYKPME
ncbi:MAG: IS66 family insertion sequence element accessory protein TnpB [Proteobacteria bacterium]|nr:IS66 family insertion sequence element accessory protein TnpB [Pseudomonadota bacterium]